MIRTVVFIAVLWLYQVAVLPVLLFALVCGALGARRFTRRFTVPITRGWAACLLRLAGVRVEVHGEIGVPADQSVLVVSNHQGAFDIPVLMVSLGRPVAFVAKRSLGRIPSVGAWMRLIGCLFLDRESPRQAIELVKRAVASLHAGDSLVIFPEGTRSNSADMASFKKGSLSIAAKAETPVIPVTVDGSWRVKQPGSSIIRPAEVHVTIGDPVSTKGLDRAARKALPETVEALVRAGLGKAGP